MAQFIRIMTYVADSEQVDMGMPIDPEKVELFFNPDYVVYVEGKGGDLGGSEISMMNGECFYVDESPQEVMQLIAKHGIHPRAN